MSLDNYDLYGDDETTSETSALGETEPEEDALEEAYVPGSGDGGGKNNNRVFMIALGVLAAVFIVAIVAMIIFASVSLPKRQQAMTQTAFVISMGNEATIMAATATADAYAKDLALTKEAAEATPTDVVPTPTLAEPTATEEVIVVPTEETEPTEDLEESIAQTATVSALLTRVAAEATATEVVEEPTPNAAQLTATAQAQATEQADDGELPDTGFMDDGGLYLVAGSAMVLIAIIVVVRRIRKG